MSILKAVKEHWHIHLIAFSVLIILGYGVYKTNSLIWFIILMYLFYYVSIQYQEYITTKYLLKVLK